MESSMASNGSGATASAAIVSSPAAPRGNWSERVFVSELPSDFLRPAGESSTVTMAEGVREDGAVTEGGSEASLRKRLEEQDRQAAVALQQHYSRYRPITQLVVGKLNLTIAQAKLTKNYGLTRMDPYVRLRLGHCVYETQTCYNGATNPRWNKGVMCYLPQGVSSMHLEIYDECSFSEDALVASATIQIPEVALQKGETVDDWYPLSGKQGDNREGMINLVINFTPLSCGEAQLPLPGTVSTAGFPAAMQPYMGMMPGVYATPPPLVGQQHPPHQQQQQLYHRQQQQQQPQPVTDEDVKQLKEMFPAMDEDIVRSVLESRAGDKTAAITSLLELAS